MELDPYLFFLDWRGCPEGQPEEKNNKKTWVCMCYYDPFVLIVCPSRIKSQNNIEVLTSDVESHDTWA